MLVYGYHHAQNGAWIVSSLFVELIFIKQHHKRLQSRPKVHPGKMEEKGKQARGCKKIEDGNDQNNERNLSETIISLLLEGFSYIF